MSWLAHFVESALVMVACFALFLMTFATIGTVSVLCWIGYQHRKEARKK